MAEKQPLSPLEHKVLEFEQQNFRYSGAKERAITEELHMHPTVYYQKLTRLIDDERALATAPMLVKRLRARRRAVHSEDRLQRRIVS